MKHPILLCVSLLILAALSCGCTNQTDVGASSPTPNAIPPQATGALASAGGPELVGTDWQLSWFDDTKGIWSKVAEGSMITAKFSADGKITGFSGCSDYVTDYQLTETPKIWFRRPTVPEKVCQTPTGVMSQQSAFYTDLEWSQTYAINDGQLLFFDKSGKKILQFDPAA